MNVLVTGTSGFIGSHLAHALRAAEHVVIEARRDIDAGTASVQADFTRDLSARAWMPKLAGIDAVINAVGIIRERGAQSFESVHKRAPQALFTACVAMGVRRVVQISALGADHGMSRYFLSKRAADDYLATLPLDWTIVRLLSDVQFHRARIELVGPQPFPLRGLLGDGNRAMSCSAAPASAPRSHRCFCTRLPCSI